MQMQMPELPHRIIITILLTHISFVALTASGGWVMYQAAISHMNATEESTVTRIAERLEPKIDANGQRIEELGERIDRNGELIAQLRERVTAVEVRIGGLEEVVRFFHPPTGELQQDP